MYVVLSSVRSRIWLIILLIIIIKTVYVLNWFNIEFETFGQILIQDIASFTIITKTKSGITLSKCMSHLLNLTGSLRLLTLNNGIKFKCKCLSVHYFLCVLVFSHSFWVETLCLTIMRIKRCLITTTFHISIKISLKLQDGIFLAHH